MDEATRQALRALGWTSYLGHDGKGTAYEGWQKGSAYFHVYHESTDGLRGVIRPAFKKER